MVVIAPALLGTAGAPMPDPAAVLSELNAFRETPQIYADRLSRSSDVPGREGGAALDDALASLVRRGRAPPLTASPLLAAIARDHVTAQAATGDVGHGAAGATPGDRARRHGGDIYVSEVISYRATTPAEVIRNLVLDDGLPKRPHRLLLEGTLFRYAGVACGPHPRFGTMCVIDLAITATGAFPMPTAAK